MDITKIDFTDIDLDKYLDWLEVEYNRFSRVNTLPLLENIYIDYKKRAFFANSHYIRTRGESLPTKITRLYQAKEVQYKKQIDELTPLPLSLIFFNSVPKDSFSKNEKYGFFSAKELAKIRIETHYLNLYRGMFKDVWQPDFIEQINNEQQKTPLSKKAFYKYKIDTLKENSFKYLDPVIKGSFIYNLNDSKTCLDFFLDLSRIWEIHYLETELLKLCSPTNTSNTPPILTLKSILNASEIALIKRELEPLFNASLEQWENLFSNHIKPPVNIGVKPTTSNRDIAYFFLELEKHGLININHWAKTLSDIKAFRSKGKFLDASQLNRAKKVKSAKIYKPNNPIIEGLIIELTETLPDKIK